MRVLRLILSGSVSVTTVVHVNGILAVGGKSRCHMFREDLNRLILVNNLSELRWYGGCGLSMDWDAGTSTFWQPVFSENTEARFGVGSGRNNPLSTGLKLDEFYENEPVGH